MHGGEKLGRYCHGAVLSAPPVREILVQADLKRVDGELKLSLDLVHELQLDASHARLVAEGKQGPLDLGGHDEHHLSRVRLLQQVPTDASLGRLLGKEIQQRSEHFFLDDVKISLATPLVDGHAEYQIHVVELQLGEAAVRMSLAETVARGTAVHADVSNRDPLSDESLSDDLHDRGGGNLQHGEVAPGVLRGQRHGLR